MRCINCGIELDFTGMFCGDVCRKEYSSRQRSAGQYNSGCKVNLENMKIDLGKGYIQDIALCSQELVRFYKENNLESVQEYIRYIKEAIKKLEKEVNNG